MPTQKNQKSGTPRNRPVWTTKDVTLTQVEALKPYRNQVRTHTDKSISRLAEGIAEFGFIMPAVIDGDGIIIAGHGRVEAAKRLGMAAIPTIRADHLTPAQVRAFRIADNRLAEMSDWNRDALRIELGDLADLQMEGVLDFDLTITGFDTPEIDLIIGDGEAGPGEEPETVEVPDPAKAAVTRPGDLWLLGPHRIFCGNSLEEASYNKVLMGETSRMVFTDPPYNCRSTATCGAGAAAHTANSPWHPARCPRPSSASS
jgi:hypothetical protein